MNYLNILKAVASGGCLTIAVGWQVCCDVCGSNSIILFLMADAILVGIILKFV